MSAWQINERLSDSVELPPAAGGGVPEGGRTPQDVRAVPGGSALKPTILLITSGKGGVGRTTLAVNLAVALSRKGSRVTLADFDFGSMDAARMLSARPRGDLAELVEGRCGAADVSATGAESVRLVVAGQQAGGPGDSRGVEADRLVDRLVGLACRDDFVILDGPVGGHPAIGCLWRAADAVWVVSTPSRIALTDAYSIVKCRVSGRIHSPVGLVVNQASNRAEALRASGLVRSAAERFLKFSLAEVGYVIQDARLQTASARRPHIVEHPRSPAGLCMEALALRMIRERAQPAAGDPISSAIVALFG